MADYKVKFEVFEGPLDLLLYLVKKEEVDIYEVNLTRIAREFVEYVDLMREFDIEIAGEFLVMASTLMYIKSKELLPVEQQVQGDDDDENEDPRWELIRKLVEYKKFKDAADNLETLEHRQEDVYPRLPAKQTFEMPEDRGPRVEVNIFDLINAVNDVIKRVEFRAGSENEIYDEQFTVPEKMAVIHERIGRRKSFKFGELFAAAASRQEVVATFLAMLEMIRLGQIKITQDAVFGEIMIIENEGEDDLETSAPLAEDSEPVAD
ncbi:MAG: segregation/condensation protein A [Verrucomicrobiota bacterium]|jgi:segregation and condensation protein A|nr:segregation/condensation protein A [Verrucomicrobiota bacterium]